MVKTPRARHSRTPREPVTIDLEPSEITKDEVVEDIGAAQSAADSGEAGVSPADSETDASVAAESSTVNAAAGNHGTDTADYGSENADERTIEEPIEDRLESEPAASGANKPSHDYAFNDTAQRASASISNPAQPRGGASVFGAGLAGAVIALLAAWGLQWAGLLSSPAQTDISPLNQEVASLKSELAQLKAAPAPDTSALSGALDQVKSQIAELQQAVAAAGGGDPAAISAMNDKIASMERAIAAAGGSGAALTDIEGQLRQASELTAQTDGRVTALEQNVAGLTTKVEQAGAQPRMALAIAATALKSAVDRGGSFEPEFETLAAVAPDAPELAELKPLAEKGVPSAAQLTEQAGPAAQAMVDALNPTDQNAGLLDRLFSSARGAVQVRPVGEVTGEDTGAHTARMEAAVKSGDYARALSEYEAIPDAIAKEAGAGFADQLRSRIAADRLVGQLMANAMKAS